jgi:type VI secretion system protein ImpA
MPFATPETLWLPISPERPAGEDLAFAPELDEIRAARKGDDPSLAQGDWVRELRTPQWPRVRAICEGLLAERSKDLRVACFYAEAMTMTAGFPGLAAGLRTVDTLLARFWESCHPSLDPSASDDHAMEERAGKIDWLNLNLTTAVRRIPLTRSDSGGYSWLDWEETLAVDNLGLRDPLAREAALREGKIPLDRIQKAVADSGPDHFQSLQLRIQEALDACDSLRTTLDGRFDQDPPSVEALAGSIQACRHRVDRVLRRSAPASPAAPPPPELAGEPAPEPAQAPPGPVEPMQPSPIRTGPIRSRTEAVQGLREIAAFFRSTEPHSPVAHLVERAAGWAEMPLGQWLAAVVKDPATLHQLNELLDITP